LRKAVKNPTIKEELKMEKLKEPYLLYLGDVSDALSAKTSIGVAQWRRDCCIGVAKLPDCLVKVENLDVMGMAEAAARGAKTLILGLANPGGSIAASWIPDIVEALNQGLDVASGLHVRLESFPQIAEAAAKSGARLINVRFYDEALPVGTGKKRSGKRLLTVGTDCSVGKMYTSLALTQEMKKQGLNVDFRATGQTGILIAGSGIPVDAVISDFISGAAEILSPDNEEDHWDIVEGQGSLFHPSYAGVSLGLLHGAQPDALVLCHEPTRKHMRHRPDYKIPELEECLATNIELAKLTNPQVKAVGIAINTSQMENREQAIAYMETVEKQLGLPCVDPGMNGVARIVRNMA
jgi:uncharacterized NAD-dependent epimerase/dehydratase family protein